MKIGRVSKYLEIKLKKRIMISFIAGLIILIIVLFRVNTSKKVTAEFMVVKKQQAFTTILAGSLRQFRLLLMGRHLYLKGNDRDLFC